MIVMSAYPLRSNASLSATIDAEPGVHGFHWKVRLIKGSTVVGDGTADTQEGANAAIEMTAAYMPGVKL